MPSRDTVTNSKRRKLLQTIGGASIVGIAGLSGCVGQEDDSNGDDDSTGGEDGVWPIDADDWPDLSGESVHYMTPDTEDATVEFWDTVAEEFQRVTGADVRIEYAGFGDQGMIPRLTQLLQAQNPPEVVDMGLTPAAGHLAEGVFGDVSDVVETNVDQYGEPPGAKLATIDGNNYNVPFKGAGIQVLWYRSDLSDITPDTWENLREYVQDVEENSDQQGIYIPTAEGQPNYLSHMMYFWSNGTTLAREEDGEIVSNLDEDRDEWLETLNLLNDLYQYSPDTRDADWGPMINTIQTGETAAVSYPGARPKNHSIYNDREFAEDVDTVIIPQNSDDARVMTGGGSLWALEDANLEAGKTFMEFVTSREVYLEFFTSVVPVHNSCPYPDLAHSDDYWDAVRENAPPAWTDEQIERYQLEVFDYEWTNSLTELGTPNPYIGEIFAENIIERMVANVLVDEEDPESELDTAHEQLNDIMQE